VVFFFFFFFFFFFEYKLVCLHCRLAETYLLPIRRRRTLFLAVSAHPFLLRQVRVYRLQQDRNVYFSPTCMHSLFLLILMTELIHSTTLHLFAAKAFIAAIACGYKWELRACFDAANLPYKQRTHNKLERESVLMNFLRLYWTKRCRLNEGIFVYLCLKNACARHMGSLPSHQTEQLDGRG